MRHILQGKVPILSNNAIHQLHIFIFALAVTHVVLSAVTVILGITQVYEKCEALCSKYYHIRSFLNILFIIYLFRQETGNIGRRRSSKAMIVVYILHMLPSYV